MSQSVILLHEEALRKSHPVFHVAPPDHRVRFVWDNDRFRELQYSMKRLVFIMENLAEMKVEVCVGRFERVVAELQGNQIFVPNARDPRIRDRWKSLPLTVVDDEPLLDQKIEGEHRRFFAYWKKAEKQWAGLKPSLKLGP